MPTLLLLAPIGLPLLAALSQAAGGWRRRTTGVGLATGALLLAATAALAAEVLRSGPIRTAGGLLRADALSAWMLLVVGAVALLVLASGDRHAVRPESRWYPILLHLFIATMATAVLAGNLGVLWVAVEATTIVTAFLVGHYRTRAALEAAWKYVLICSAAIALALLGTVLLYYAARHAGLAGLSALDWSNLAAHAGRMDPAVTRIAIGLAVLGFGAKAGLVPLHAWLPDAHSQAPAPISALMSGVLLSVALYAVLRLKLVADAVLDPAYLRTLLLILALATLAVAVALLLGQHDYKRLLAYSSMEHMGLMALGVAVGGPLAMAAVLLHIAGHGLAKTVAFLGSGHILHREGTTRIAGVRGLLSRAPVLGGVFGVATLALLGLPPGALFASEVGLARALAAEQLGWVVALAFALVLVGFAAIGARTAGMLLGAPAPAITESATTEPTAPAPVAREPVGVGATASGHAAAGGAATPPVPAGAATAPVPAGASSPGPGESRLAASQARPDLPRSAAVPLVVGLVVVALLGVTTWPLTDLLTAAASIAGGS